MSNLFGNKGAGDAAASMARRREQQGNEAELRARQQAERGSITRGRDMLVGRLNKVLPTNLGGV